MFTWRRVSAAVGSALTAVGAATYPYGEYGIFGWFDYRSTDGWHMYEYYEVWGPEFASVEKGLFIMKLAKKYRENTNPPSPVVETKSAFWISRGIPGLRWELAKSSERVELPLDISADEVHSVVNQMRRERRERAWPWWKWVLQE